MSIGVLKTYLLTKNDVSRSKRSKVRARTGQTDAQTEATEALQRHIRSW